VVPATPVTLALIGLEGVGRSSIARCILGHEHDAEDRVVFHTTSPSGVTTTSWAVRVISLGDADEHSGRLAELAPIADIFAFVYDVGSADSFEFLSSAQHIVRKSIAKKHGLPPPRPENTPESNPFVFAVIANKADTPAADRQVPVSDGATFARAGGGIFRETSARTSADEPADESGGPSGAVEALLRALARARNFRRQPGKQFSPNIAVLDQLSAEIHGGLETPTIRLSEGAYEASEKSDKDARHRKKASKDLRMDRRASRSIGGLGRDPVAFVDGTEKKRCCIVS